MIAATLEQAFESIISTFNLKATLSVDGLMSYAAEDHFGGRDTGDFPIAVSIYRQEGQFLYALVRALKPNLCLELGCADGGSSTHLLAALRANVGGKLISVDIDGNSGNMIPQYLRDRWLLIQDDAKEIMLHADFIFEDTDHTYATTKILLQDALQMRPVCIISHDYLLCEEVKRAWDEVFGIGNFVVMLLGTGFASTGLACWMLKGVL